MTDLTGHHPNVMIEITGYDWIVPNPLREKYPVGQKFAHAPIITGIKYKMLFLDGWTTEEERQQILCPICHPMHQIFEADYVIGKRYKSPVSL